MFTTYSKLAPFFHSSVAKFLTSDSELAKYVAEAKEIVAHYCGVVLTDDVDESPAWIHYPAALIISKLVIGRINASPELVELCSRDHSRAVKYLRERAGGVNSSGLSIVSQGKIDGEGVSTW